MNWQEGTKERRDNILAAYPDKIFGRVEVGRSIDYVHEGSEWKRTVVVVKDLGWEFCVTGQCGEVREEFDIGGVEDARQLVSELQEAIKYCETFGALVYNDFTSEETVDSGAGTGAGTERQGDGLSPK